MPTGKDALIKLLGLSNVGDMWKALIWAVSIQNFQTDVYILSFSHRKQQFF
jgi:hypothetical protein